ncbi:winged helix-turn-helix transcriptional regulator [Peptostreptococcus faecalis]|uniref:winged helix-turn-helix transcriptional regulator n=1 Tax=Peptostreptococcus faecalis TaxID=2045015 RepID=UPI000C7A14BE|nr:helix-turn-helix domain-containing protein [Peptostreptococcus faecalis]
MESKEETHKLYDEESMFCPILNVVGAIGGKWKLPILCILAANESQRYGVLKRKLEKITNTMLSQSLKELEKDLLVSRIQYNEIPPRVEYSLTDRGKSLVPILEKLVNWGIENIEQGINRNLKCRNCR